MVKQNIGIGFQQLKHLTEDGEKDVTNMGANWALTTGARNHKCKNARWSHSDDEQGGLIVMKEQGFEILNSTIR